MVGAGMAIEDPSTGSGGQGPSTGAAQEGDAAVRAFDDVRAEVSSLRRAIERLSAERTEPSEAVDYSETLGGMSSAITGIAQMVDLLAKSPSLSITPETLGGRIANAASAVRREDQQIISQAGAAMDHAARQLGGMVVSARAHGEQNRWLVWMAIGGAVVGMGLWATLAGTVARAMPDAWHWPERMAARTLRLPMWDAGQRLMVAASPNGFAMLGSDSRTMAANRAVVEGCAKAAAKAQETVRCAIRVDSRH
jgi:hypothetical protein